MSAPGSAATGRSGPLREAEKEYVETECIFAASEGIPSRRSRQCIQDLISLYESWEKAEPGKGHDKMAAQWREKINDDRASSRPAGGN
jgi:hypothetical protein